jgi:hypothetical protein
MKTKFNDNMLEILKTMKGKKLINIECEFEKEFKRSYGYIRLNFSGKSIDITNVEEPVNLFGTIEDVAVFNCYDNTGKTLKESFNLIDNYNPQRLGINEIINGVEVISEKIKLNNIDEIEFDMCIILKTDAHNYLISRENWFNEFIYLNADTDFNDVYKISDDKNIWNFENNKSVQIVRTKIKL